MKAGTLERIEAVEDGIVLRDEVERKGGAHQRPCNASSPRCALQPYPKANTNVDRRNTRPFRPQVQLAGGQHGITIGRLSQGQFLLPGHFTRHRDRTAWTVNSSLQYPGVRIKNRPPEG